MLTVNDLSSEVAAVHHQADELGWSRYHLSGFSAGATVALASARAFLDTVRTVALFEPATIADDDWSPTEQRWRHDLYQIRLLPPQQRQPAFRRMLMARGETVPFELGAPAPRDAKTDKLEDLLASVGFDSNALNTLNQPALIMTGSRSDPRFYRLADRLVEVVPYATSTTLSSCSHLSPPHRTCPHQLEQLLIRLWSTVSSTSART